MKTLSDIKRRFAKKESIVMTFHNYQPNMIGRVFTPEKIQTNAVMFAGKYWHYYRKATEYRIDGPDSFTVMNEGLPLVSYKFVQEEPTT